MYVGPIFAPLSLLGLLFRGSTVATAVPKTMVSVIVPVYNRERAIEQCIRHLQEQSLRPAEIIVVDDCSTDGTPVILGRLSKIYGNLVTLRNPRNLGKSASVNAALKIARFPYTAVVDSDTNLDVDYLRNVLGAFHGDEVVGASGTILPAENTNGISRSRLIEYLHGQATHKKLQEKMGALFVSPGCCSVWRTSWIKDNGVPTETVVEDMDLTWEAQIDGKKIAYVPDAIARTEEPENFAGYAKQISRWFSWRPVLEKHAKCMTNGLKFLVSWILVESISYAVWIGLTLYFILQGNYLSALLLFLADLLIIALVSVYQGRKVHLAPRTILGAIPFYYILKIPTVLVFWKSLLFPKRVGW